jgi:RNA polymerase sigma-70 factor (ECF subfamily)
VADRTYPADLIQKARNGDPSAFEELVRPHLDSLRRFIFSLSSNWQDADDIAQETLLKAFRSFKTFDDRASLSTWLYTVARSTCVDWSRSRIGKVRPHKPLKETLPAKGPNQDELLDAKLNAELLWRAIEQLDEKHRSVLVLFDIEGISYEEIAQIESVPVGTIRSRLSRARSRLLELLTPPEVSLALAAASSRRHA